MFNHLFAYYREVITDCILNQLHFQDEVRGMTLSPDTTWPEFLARVAAKFSRPADAFGLGMQFVDEDGARVSLRDDSDYELAIETAREVMATKRGSGSASEGKLVVWVADS